MRLVEQDHEHAVVDIGAQRRRGCDDGECLYRLSVWITPRIPDSGESENPPSAMVKQKGVLVLPSLRHS